MRTVKELFEKHIQREDMTTEEHIAFINYWFDKYEKEGFSKVFCSPYQLTDGEGNWRNGQKYTVLGRVKPMFEDKENGADLDTLPLWEIQFEDGYKMAAYQEEIIPSEIKDNICRESDKQLISQL